MGKTDGKRPLGRHKLRWKDNIKMDLQLFKRSNELPGSIKARNFLTS